MPAGATLSLRGSSRHATKYGADTLDRSIAEALAAGTPHLAAVRQILDRRRREAGLPPPIAVDLPDDIRCFIADLGLSEDRFLTAFEVVPGDVVELFSIAQK